MFRTTTLVEEVVDSVALPAEVSAGIPALEQAVTCNTKVCDLDLLL